MADELRRGLDRIERLVEIRQTYVTAAEAAVREAEGVVRRLEALAEENARQVQHARENFAYPGSFTGGDVQTRERHIEMLNLQAGKIRQDVEKATQILESKRAEWRETMKDRKIIERVQERRLQEWERIVDAKQQKDVDEMSVVKYARSKSDSNNISPAAEPDELHR